MISLLGVSGILGRHLSEIGRWSVLERLGPGFGENQELHRIASRDETAPMASERQQTIDGYQQRAIDNARAPLTPS